MNRARSPGPETVRPQEIGRRGGRAAPHQEWLLVAQEEQDPRRLTMPRILL
jgi:hypothetical protein